ncbi:unnamed protein product [Cuscuta europaea]|uniref:Uncharacterized protein n=1 Tax=Cuscuta europaea TaxID=41803 RepID=A0A9P0ZJ35_CUSEU|nr:unnamed protein product [Cuscuta europaea]
MAFWSWVLTGSVFELDWPEKMTGGTGAITGPPLFSFSLVLELLCVWCNLTANRSPEPGGLIRLLLLELPATVRTAPETVYCRRWRLPGSNEGGRWGELGWALFSG